MLFTAILASCSAPPIDTGAVPPELLLKVVGFRFFQGSTLKAIGSADRVSFRRETGDVDGDHVEIRFQGATAEDDVELFAVQAAGNVDRQQADGTRGVRLVDAQGTTGTTDAAHFDGVRELASGTAPIDVAGSGFVLTGAAGFELPLARGGILNVFGPVHARSREVR